MIHMIKVVAKQVVREEKIEDFIAIAKELVEKTHQEDIGCLAYNLYQDTNNAKVLTFIEEWENQEVLDKHMASKHFNELFPQLGNLLEEPSEITLYQKIK